jgi:hypothetical protein
MLWSSIPQTDQKDEVNLQRKTIIKDKYPLPREESDVGTIEDNQIDDTYICIISPSPMDIILQLEVHNDGKLP